MSSIELYARAKAFSCAPFQTYLFSVDLEGMVWVWDATGGGHFTSNHSLTPYAIKRIRGIAKKLAQESK